MQISTKISALVIAFLVAGCSPEIGSEAWCENMDAKDKGDWTVNDASEYAKSCVFRKKD